jgi:hypothetical protein
MFPRRISPVRRFYASLPRTGVFNGVVFVFLTILFVVYFEFKGYVFYHLRLFFEVIQMYVGVLVVRPNSTFKQRSFAAAALARTARSSLLRMLAAAV